MDANNEYLLLQVDSLNEAIAIACSCPTLKFDMQAEVRPIAGECPSMAYARQIISEQQFATA